MPTPIYTPENCNFAYQLDWSLSVFWRSPPTTDAWLPALQQATEAEGVRVLRHRFERPDLSLFLVSTRPHVPAHAIPKSVKGRLQYLVRDRLSKAFQRNYALRSIGSTTRDTLDHYLAAQLEHHPLADPRMEERFAHYQIHNPEIDLSQPRQTAHAVNWYNLHVVLVHAERWREIRDELLQKVHAMLLRSSTAKGHLLARAAILPDHFHLMLGCQVEESPQQVMLSYLNNLAYVWGMRPIFQFGGFVGTFGEYDLGAVQ